MKWLLMWLNISVATLNATLQLLVIYRCFQQLFGCCNDILLQRLSCYCNTYLDIESKLEAFVF